MKTVYLKNGQKCELLNELPNGEFLVEEYYEYSGYEEERYEELCGIKRVVSEIFPVAPVEVIDKEVVKKQSELSELTTKVNNLKIEEINLTNQIANITKTIIDKDKFIINRSDLLNAKNIVVFTQKTIMPRETAKEKYGYKIHLDIQVRTGEERGWYYNLYHEDDRFSYSQYIDKMLFDPTQEEIDKIIMERIDKVKDDFKRLIGVPEKYLNALQKEGVRQLNLSDKQNKIERLQKEIESKNAEIMKLLS